MKHPYINLLRGDFIGKKSRLTHASKAVKFVFLLAISWLVLIVFYPAVSYFILFSKLNEIKGGIEQIYKNNFPLATNVVTPKLRMQDKLRELEGRAGENRMLSLLAYVGKGLNNEKNVKLKRIDFQNGQLMLE